MSKTMRAPAALALFLALAIPARQASADSGPTYRSLQSQAMGFTGTGAIGGTDALFLNPAGLAGGDGGNFGITVVQGLNSVLLDYAAWVADNAKHFTDIDTISRKMDPIDNKWAPFSSSVVVKGRYEDIAFAGFWDTRYNLALSKAVLTPVIGVGALSDIVLTAGRGVEGPEGYQLGVTVKYLYRLRYRDQLVGTGDQDFYTVSRALRKPDKGMMSRLAKISVAGNIAETQQGVGLNLGVQKDVTENWTAGLSLIDFPTIIDAKFARPDFNLGVGYHRDVDWLEGLDNRILFNVDMQRFLAPGTPWWRQLKFGTAFEGYMKKRQVAYIALGVNDGYPSFGARVGYLLYLSYVYVAQETGTYPGQEKLSFHKIAVDIDL